jgi:hypothetical protein
MFIEELIVFVTVNNKRLGRIVVGRQWGKG